MGAVDTAAEVAARTAGSLVRWQREGVQRCALAASVAVRPKSPIDARTERSGVEDASQGGAAGPRVHERLLARVPDVQQLL